jgi:hypothetical protein
MDSNASNRSTANAACRTLTEHDDELLELMAQMLEESATPTTVSSTLTGLTAECDCHKAVCRSWRAAT